LPLVAKSFVKAAAVSPRGDTDDTYFPAYSGQTIAVTVKLAKGSTLIPGLELYRPDARR